MQDLKSVLVAVDFSKGSRRALKEGARIAGWDRAQLAVVHVLERELSEHFRARHNLDEAGLLQRTRSRLQAFVEETIGKNRAASCEIKVGNPFEGMLAASRELDADILVMGTEGLTQDRRETGIIACKCVRQAPLPVLLVSEFQDRPFQKIVACVDFSETSRIALEHAVEIAAQDRASLVVLHVIAPIADLLNDIGAFAHVSSPLPEIDYAGMAREQTEAFLDPLRDRLKTVSFSIKIVERMGVSGAIVAELKDSRADLLVLGTQGRAGIRKLLMGTTAERVLRRVPCSVLAVKPVDFAQGEAD